MFTMDNTVGYTAEQLIQFNEELAEKLAGLDVGSDEYYQTQKAFADEVSRRN